MLLDLRLEFWTLLAKSKFRNKFSKMDSSERAHKESYSAHLPPPHPPKPISSSFYFVCLLGSFFGCAPMDGLLHTLALTKKLGSSKPTLQEQGMSNCTLGCLGM